MTKEIYNNNSQIRLDLFLTNYIKNISRTKIQKLIISGLIKVDGYIVKSSFLLKGGEVINVNNTHIDKPITLVKQNIPLDIIYEDESIIVINKPSGMVVHPGAGNKTGTLLNGLIYHFKELSNIDAKRPGIIHRLDKETSGVLIVAKTDYAHYFLGEQFANRNVKKKYRAIVWGNINDNGVIKGFLTRNKKERTIFSLNDNHGKYSYTKYKKLNYFSPLSYIELYPSTGRTHQLRVHLSYLGYPILLDSKYNGGKSLQNSFHQKYQNKLYKIFKIINRFALHAHKIEIKHPVTKKNMEFIAPISNDMQNIISLLNEYE